MAVEMQSLGQGGSVTMDVQSEPPKPGSQRHAARARSGETEIRMQAARACEAPRCGLGGVRAGRRAGWEACGLGDGEFDYHYAHPLPSRSHEHCTSRGTRCARSNPPLRSRGCSSSGRAHTCRCQSTRSCKAAAQCTHRHPSPAHTRTHRRRNPLFPNNWKCS